MSYGGKTILMGAAFACGVAALLSAPSLPRAQEEPLYEPLVDRDARGFKEGKYAKDLAFCRNRAAPQERLAREGVSQAAGGAALATAGNIARFMPVPGLGAAQGLWAGGSAAEAVGSAAAGHGAMTAEQAMQDYVLVVNACLERRGYLLLR
ncbi:hypothetical protein MSC49_08070 [Methylosinus sp. C49]|uniref:hypothetical protein n=1 Tax=Methylosinus sp. C49 TaxID=2699395 RepID=UPI001366F3EF|nr:hypothetical protein [Methylosinus sp. C49]BBU60872.1 hypothetical protein MSC49_08070 [Methylosinus sp. C49]